MGKEYARFLECKYAKNKPEFRKPDCGAKNERRSVMRGKRCISKLLCVGAGLSALLSKMGYSCPLLLC